MNISSAKYSCTGGHEINEDSYMCSAEKGIFIVADGLGGHSGGEKASLAAIEYFKEHCCGNYTNECISDLLEGANKEVMGKGDGGKTTVAAAFVENGKFIYANVGDSRVYYFRDGKIIAQTKDHSVCQASVDMGMIRPEDIRGNEDRSRLLKVLGNDESLNIKKFYPPLKIMNGDAFLVCSDGFWEYVCEPEMEADLLKSDNSETWLKYMLKRHILRSENKGDNYTALCGIFYLDGNEEFDRTVPSGEALKKDLPLVPVVAAAAAVIALIAAFFLIKRNEEIPSSVTENTNDIIQTFADTERESTPIETENEELLSSAESETEVDTETENTPTETENEETLSSTENETEVDNTTESTPAKTENGESLPAAGNETAVNNEVENTPTEPENGEPLPAAESETDVNTETESTTTETAEEGSDESSASSDTVPVFAAPSAARPAQTSETSAGS